MKKFMTLLVALVTMTATASAMSYEQARQQALFLTDKMAYELNLNDAQYEAAYEINLDYLMGVNTYDDLYGPYWVQRNTDLGYILLDWQYQAYCAASYFYRPLYWDAGYWHFGIYARYPYRDYFFFDRPRVYVSYVGGHSWHHNGGRSWYHGRDFGPRPGGHEVGMRDRFNRGDYGNGRSFGNRQPRNEGGMQGGRGTQDVRTTQPGTTNRSGSFGGRGSSTRRTVTQPSGTESRTSVGGRTGGTTTTQPRGTFTRSTTAPTTVNRTPSMDRSVSRPTPSVSTQPSRSVSRSSGASAPRGGAPSGGSRSGGGSFGGRR